jgi:hypothetical protein
VGSPEGLGFAPSHLWLCPKNPVGWLSAPNTPDQRVTLSLETPPSGLAPWEPRAGSDPLPAPSD